jgi:hypothetical protein
VKKALKSEVGMRGESLKGLGYYDLGFPIKPAQSKTRQDAGKRGDGAS